MYKRITDEPIMPIVYVIMWRHTDSKEWRYLYGVSSTTFYVFISI